MKILPLKNEDFCVRYGRWCHRIRCQVWGVLFRGTHFCYVIYCEFRLKWPVFREKTVLKNVHFKLNSQWSIHLPLVLGILYDIYTPPGAGTFPWRWKPCCLAWSSWTVDMSLDVSQAGLPMVRFICFSTVCRLILVSWDWLWSHLEINVRLTWDWQTVEKL